MNGAEGFDGEDQALAAIVRSSQDAVIAKTVDGTVTAWNDGARALYGYAPHEILGRPIDVTFPEDTHDEETARHARVAAGAAESGYRCRRLRADGTTVEVVMSMLPVRDRTGAVVGLASISRPVSDEERAQAQFAALVEAAPDAIVGFDHDGLVTVANRRTEALFGLSEGELVGAPVEHLVPGLLDAVRQPGDRTRRSDGLVGRGPRGTTFPVSASTSVVGDGARTWTVATLRDVSAQLRAEAELLEQTTRLRQLAENVSTVFTLRQIEPLEYLYVSPGLEQLTGFRPEDFYADPELAFGTLIHPDDREEAERLRTMADGTGSLTMEVRIIARDGQVKWVRATTSVVPNPDGPPERMVGMAEDITDRVEGQERLRRAEAEARAANEAKNQFLSRMSHELRTPLNAVLGFGQLLELRMRGTSDEDAVHHVLNGGRHLLSLIDDVLDISRIESGQMALSVEPVPLAELVSQAVHLMAPTALKADVRLVPPRERDVQVLADVQRLRQVLLNLLSNAIKYHRKGGTVEVDWTTDGDLVAIRVSDDGPGIPAALQHRLFQPFDRLGAEATAVEGTGVGLALSRALVELMDGHIDCVSDEGEGSVFTVTLPAAVAGPRPAQQGEEDALGQRPTPERACTLLYVEDNTANVEVMRAVLELRPEWAFVHAALGGLALELARAHGPDLVLLDLHLPDTSGIDVLRALRADPTTASTRVVVLSADASRTTIRDVREQGADDYLTKPYDLDALLAVLDDASASAPGRRPT